MKEIEIYEIRDEIINGDSYSEYTYSEADAECIARNLWYHLTPLERKKRNVYVIGYVLNFENNIELPQKASQLVDMLFNEEIETPDFNLNMAFANAKEIYYKEISEILEQERD